MSALEFHPLADIFPLLDGQDFAELVADIREHGLHEPIVVYEDKILDGRNRYRACEAARVEPTFTAYTGDDPLAYVISLNLRRRHLSESQRAIVAAKLEQFEHGGDRRSDQDANFHLDREGAASLLNVSERTVASATKVLDQGAPELVQAVERGDVSVSAAAEVAGLPKSEQRKALAGGDKTVRAKAKELRGKRAKKSVRNSLVVAWTRADPEARRAFVRVCWIEIMRTRDQIDGNAQADEIPDRWIESDR